MATKLVLSILVAVLVYHMWPNDRSGVLTVRDINGSYDYIIGELMLSLGFLRCLPAARIIHKIKIIIKLVCIERKTRRTGYF